MLEKETLYKIYKTMSLSQLKEQIVNLDKILKPVIDETLDLRDLISKNSYALHVYFTLLKKMRTLNDNLATLKNKEASSLEIESVKSKIKSTAKALTFFENEYAEAIKAYKRRKEIGKLYAKDFNKKIMLIKIFKAKVKQQNEEKIKE